MFEKAYCVGSAVCMFGVTVQQAYNKLTVIDKAAIPVVETRELWQSLGLSQHGALEFYVHTTYTRRACADVGFDVGLPRATQSKAGLV